MKKATIPNTTQTTIVQILSGFFVPETLQFFSLKECLTLAIIQNFEQKNIRKCREILKFQNLRQQRKRL